MGINVQLPSNGGISNHNVGSTDNVHEMLNDVFKKAIFDDKHVNTCSMNDDDSSKFYAYVKYDNQEIYSGCKLTKLGVIVGLFHIRCLNKV